MALGDFSKGDITELPDWNNAFIYGSNLYYESGGTLKFYSFSDSGALSLIDSLELSTSYTSTYLWGSGAYIVTQIGMDLMLVKIDGGNLSFVDSVELNIKAVHGNGLRFFTLSSSNTLVSWSITADIMVEKDDFAVGSGDHLFFDGNILFILYDNGIKSFSIDLAGNLTLIDTKLCALDEWDDAEGFGVTNGYAVFNVDKTLYKVAIDTAGNFGTVSSHTTTFPHSQCGNGVIFNYGCDDIYADTPVCGIDSLSLAFAVIDSDRAYTLANCPTEIAVGDSFFIVPSEVVCVEISISGWILQCNHYGEAVDGRVIINGSIYYEFSTTYNCSECSQGGYSGNYWGNQCNFTFKAAVGATLTYEARPLGGSWELFFDPHIDVPATAPFVDTDYDLLCTVY